MLAKKPEKGWRKDQIIEMAAVCFMERGYHATTIEHVAERIGSTKGRIYHYYNSKTDLFLDVQRVGMAKLFAALQPALLTCGDGLTVLKAMLLAHANAMLKHHTFENVVAQGMQIHWFGPVNDEQHQTLEEVRVDRHRFEDYFKHAIAAGVADGSLRPVDISMTAKVLLGGLHWSTFWYRPRPQDTTKTRALLAQKMVDPLVEGLRPHTSAR